MDIDKLNSYKENKEIKFIYKIPCSLYEERFKYIIIGNIQTKQDRNEFYFSLEDWFSEMMSGGLLCYVCAILPRRYKIKEHLNIYVKPDLLKLRKYICSLTDDNKIIEHSLWGVQLIEEFKINRFDVFKEGHTKQFALQEFLDKVEPIFKKSIDGK